MTPAQPLSSAARAGAGSSAARSANNGAPDAVSRFYARNGDVFMTSAWGGFYLSEGEQARMLDAWRRDEADPFSAANRAALADELERAMTDAARQKEPMQ